MVSKWDHNGLKEVKVPAAVFKSVEMKRKSRVYSEPCETTAV